MQGKDDDGYAQINYGIILDWDDLTGKPRIQTKDVNPGEEQGVADLARMLLGAVNDATAKSETIAAPILNAPTPTVDEAIAAVLADRDTKQSTKKEYARAFQFFRSFVGGGTHLADIP